MIKLVTLEEFVQQVKEIEGVNIVTKRGPIYDVRKKIEQDYPGVRAAVYFPSYDREPLPDEATADDLNEILYTYVESRVIVLDLKHAMN